MRTKATIITLAAMLLVPGTASATTGAYGEYPEPTGMVCSTTPTDRNCADMSSMVLFQEDFYSLTDYNRNNSGYWFPATNTYDLGTPNCWYGYKSMDLWRSMGSPSGVKDCVYVGTEAIGRTYKSWRFNDIPVEDRDKIMPRQEINHSELRVGGNLVRVQVGVSALRDQGVDGFCSYYSNGRWLNDRSAPALDRTPDSIMAACSFTRRQSDPAPTTDETTETTTTEASPDRVGRVIIPRRSARCGAVRPPSGRVVVRSTKYRCGAARSVVARYARTLKSPRGWSCVASVSDRGMRARCVRKAKGRAVQRGAVYGIWLRR